MITKEQMKPGILVRIPDMTPDVEDPDTVVATVVGFDPYEERWVVACPTWSMGISHIEDDDYEHMEIVEPELDDSVIEDQIAEGERAIDQILDERERTGL